MTTPAYVSEFSQRALAFVQNKAKKCEPENSYFDCAKIHLLHVTAFPTITALESGYLAARTISYIPFVIQDFILSLIPFLKITKSAPTNTEQMNDAASKALSNIRHSFTQTFHGFTKHATHLKKNITQEKTWKEWFLGTSVTEEQANLVIRFLSNPKTVGTIATFAVATYAYYYFQSPALTPVVPIPLVPEPIQDVSSFSYAPVVILPITVASGMLYRKWSAPKKETIVVLPPVDKNVDNQLKEELKDKFPEPVTPQAMPTSPSGSSSCGNSWTSDDLDTLLRRNQELEKMLLDRESKVPQPLPKTNTQAERELQQTRAKLQELQQQVETLKTVQAKTAYVEASNKFVSMLTPAPSHEFAPPPPPPPMTEGGAPPPPPPPGGAMPSNWAAQTAPPVAPKVLTEAEKNQEYWNEKSESRADTASFREFPKRKAEAQEVITNFRNISDLSEEQQKELEKIAKGAPKDPSADELQTRLGEDCDTVELEQLIKILFAGYPTDNMDEEPPTKVELYKKDKSLIDRVLAKELVYKAEDIQTHRHILTKSEEWQEFLEQRNGYAESVINAYKARIGSPTKKRFSSAISEEDRNGILENLLDKKYKFKSENIFGDTFKNAFSQLSDGDIQILVQLCLQVYTPEQASEHEKLVFQELKEKRAVGGQDSNIQKKHAQWIAFFSNPQKNRTYAKPLLEYYIAEFRPAPQTEPARPDYKEAEVRQVSTPVPERKPAVDADALQNALLRRSARNSTDSKDIRNKGASPLTE